MLLPAYCTVILLSSVYRTLEIHPNERDTREYDKNVDQLPTTEFSFTMKVAGRTTRVKFSEEPVAPIPLRRPDESKGDDKEAQMTFKLRSIPTQANSPTYEVTVKYFDTGLPEEWLLLRRKFDEICVGQNLLTGVQRFTLMRTLLRGDALAFPCQSRLVSPATLYSARFAIVGEDHEDCP